MFQMDLQSENWQDGQRPFLNEDEFLQKYRMTRTSFSKLVSLIEDDPVFTPPSTGPNQHPVQHQLMVFLKYLGTEGVGNSNSDLRNMFKTGRGTNELYKLRVAKAIQHLRPLYYTWPGINEREAISTRIERICRLPYCVGFVDGTMNPLATKPRRNDAADYFGRKQRYALSTMVICDDKRMICYYLAGWPGSCHDNRIFRNSKVGMQPGLYFGHNQYILGDSAFEASPTVIPAYKKPNGHALPYEHENFNKCLSSARVISEHAIGIWKARFPWLRNIPMVLTEDEKSSRRILEFIECTVILHNFLIIENETEIPDDWLDSDDIYHLHENDELNLPLSPNDPKNKRQTQLMHYINELLY
jgi:hypothetical protein